MYCDQAAVYGNPRRTRRSGCLSYIGTLGLQNKFHMFQIYDSQKYKKIGQSPQQFVSQLKFEYVSIIPRATAQGGPAQEKNALNPLGHNL